MKDRCLKDGNISIWSYTDSFLAFILDAYWDGTIEWFVYRDKETGEMKYIRDCPKALNKFNNKTLGDDCWDSICAPKHVKYYIEMYRCNGK
eukprot:107124-Ditylum_brightwellii.AAC.1